MHTRPPPAGIPWTRPPEPRQRPEGSRPGSVPAVCFILLSAVLLFTGCQPDSEAGDTQDSPAESLTVGDPATQTPSDTAAATPEPAPTPQTAGQPAAPAQTTPDSLPPTLADIMAVQERILARLDSMETRVQATGAESAGPTDQTGGIDLEEARDEVTNLGFAIFVSILVLILVRFAIRAVIWILETLAERSVTRRLTFKWLIPITRMLLWGIATYLIVRTVFGVDARGILAASAAIGVALGLAAQDLLKNIFGGLTVVFDQPFQVGDKISVGGTYGEVVSIGLRSTRIVTADDDQVTVPNSQVIEEQVANANAGQLNCQVLTNLYLPGRVDERMAKEIAFEAAVNSKYVFLEKPIQVFIEDEFHTTFVTRVKVRAYVLDPRFEFLLRSDITERARDGFRAAGLAPEHDWYPLATVPDTVEPDSPARR